MVPESLFLDDNAQPYSSVDIFQPLKSGYIEPMKWPAYSSDIYLVVQTKDAFGTHVLQKEPAHTQLELKIVHKKE
ncbi:hypothetical protein TNIN_4821 [Trichonephila inaurata madagascariensis]|uniref:Uncharacterized protein n=1 Tax=Trichonephila inaurata madagascariensis TaxID=2747483 RepID=A0A8X6XCL3_9ARAC|nr:hypothetical protein TNIN_4821 [Trichonephila inaurata madagascariensis]